MKNKRPYRYPLARPELGPLERNYLVDAFDSGRISSSGDYVVRFEKHFARYIGARFGVATSSGTSALHLALASLGIGRGDEVIVPDLTFISPANMVAQTGARPVFADSNRDYWGVDGNSIKARISKKTKAVIAVHLYGHPVNLDEVVELCKSRDLALIEDCAEAHGALYRGKKVGTFGRISCFSFYGNKLLTTGEGGMCLTGEPELDTKLKLLRDHGADRSRHFWHPVAGYNYRMTNMQAAIGCAQLKTLSSRIKKYRKIGQYYTRALEQQVGEDKVSGHPELEWAKCVYWMYTFLLKEQKRKDSLILRLSSKGVESRPMFYPVSSLPPYRRAESQHKNKVAYSLSKSGISIPTYAGLTREDQDRIVALIAKFCKNSG